MSHRTDSRLPRWLLSALLLISTSALAATSQQELLNKLDMMDQLDDMDRQQFGTLLDNADNCTRTANFVCARQQLGEARPLVFEQPMKRRLDEADARLQAAESDAANLVRQTIDARPSAQLKKTCPYPFPDISWRHARNDDFDTLTRDMARMNRDNEDFEDCSQAFTEQYGLNDWASVLDDMQRLEQSLAAIDQPVNDIRSLSLASERKAMQEYQDRVEDDIQDIRRGYGPLIESALANEQNSQNNSNSLMAINSTLQGINQQMQQNNAQSQARLNNLMAQARAEQAARQQAEREAAQRRIATSANNRQQEYDNSSSRRSTSKAPVVRYTNPTSQQFNLHASGAVHSTPQGSSTSASGSSATSASGSNHPTTATPQTTGNTSTTAAIASKTTQQAKTTPGPGGAAVCVAHQRLPSGLSTDIEYFIQYNRNQDAFKAEHAARQAFKSRHDGDPTCARSGIDQTGTVVVIHFSEKNDHAEDNHTPLQSYVMGFGTNQAEAIADARHNITAYGSWTWTQKIGFDVVEAIDY
jgi:hypothetical protein